MMTGYKLPVCKPKLREFSQYTDDGEPGLACYVNPDDVMVVKEYKYHSFRSSIGEITLRNGEKIRVWETVDEIQRRLQ